MRNGLPSSRAMSDATRSSVRAISAFDGGAARAGSGAAFAGAGLGLDRVDRGFRGPLACPAGDRRARGRFPAPRARRPLSARFAMDSPPLPVRLLAPEQCPQFGFREGADAVLPRRVELAAGVLAHDQVV